MSPIAFEVSDCPPAIRRPIWLGGPRFARCCCHSDRIWLCLSGGLQSLCHLVGVCSRLLRCVLVQPEAGYEDCCASPRSPRASIPASVSFSGVSVDRRPSVRRRWRRQEARNRWLCFLSFRSDRARSSLTSRALRMPCPHSG